MRIEGEILTLLQLVLQFAVVPLIIVLYKLYNTLGDLRVLLYKDFVTKQELESRFRLHGQNRHGDEE